MLSQVGYRSAPSVERKANASVGEKLGVRLAGRRATITGRPAVTCLQTALPRIERGDEHSAARARLIGEVEQHQTGSAGLGSERVPRQTLARGVSIERAPAVVERLILGAES